MNDQPRLPPGQSLTHKFPVVGEKEPASGGLDLSAWELVVDGLVGRPLALSWSEYLALPHRERVVDIHCVTGWSRLGTRFLGIPLREFLSLVEPAPEAWFVRFEASSPRRHDTSLPLDLALSDTWLVHAVDGAPLSVEHGYPVRTLTPSRYFYKSLKWVRRISLLAEDQLGFWERDSSYHNVGDPWPGDQRFTTGSLDPDDLARFRDATSFGPWRSERKVLLGLDLRDWRPGSRDLSRLQLKNCDLRGADFAGCDLSSSNLSLSDLRGASLSGANLRRADLEGVNFTGADLRGCDLSDTALSATRFFEDHRDHRIQALVSDLRFDGASGLLEDQEEFLRAHVG